MSPLAPKYTDPNGDSVGGTSGRNLEIPTKVLTGFLFFVLGIIILLLLLLITVATAVTKSSWWTRRRRTCQRRMDHLGVNKTPLLEDRIFYYADICLEAIAFHWDESEQLVIKPPVKPKTNDQLTVDGTQLPLRFQPEKLYGATSTIHRDNMRKRSFSTLSVQPSPDGHRRASMIESLSFLSPANCMKMGKTPDDQPPRLPGYKLAYPQYEGSQSTGWNVGTLPQIDITCDQDLTGDETDGIDGSRSDREADVNSVLSISIPVRRASATNIKVVGPVLNRRASFVDACAIPALSITGDSTSSGEKDSGKDNISSGTNMLRPAQNNIVKRNSLVEDLSNYRNIPLKAPTGCSLTDDELTRVTDSVDNESVSDSTTHERKLSLSVPESPLKLPHTPPNKAMDSPAGYVALSITSIDDKAAGNEKLLITFSMGKLLKSPRPWQKSNFTLRCTYRSLNQVQQAALVCKDGELGRLLFPHNAQVTFEMCDREPKQHATTMNQLKISVIESGSKWSTEREYYHGIINIQLSGIQILTGKPEWYPISAAYPVIRIKADLLVSLCQRPLEGLISVGVHEIRNIELQKQGPYSIGDLDQLTHMEQSGFEIHACLTYDGQLIKSKKSVFLQQPRNNLLPSKPQTNVEKRLSVSSTRHLMSFSRTVSGEHYLQFTIPHSKKNIGKHVLSNYGIVLFVTHKLALTDQLPADFVNQLKLIGAPELKSLQAVGDCFIADESTQTDYWTKVSFNVKCDSQCASLWNEAASHGSSRVYQWLTTT